jgi:uncharacterized membrane protein YraQ (UPF0718 family)
VRQASGCGVLIALVAVAVLSWALGAAYVILAIGLAVLVGLAERPIRRWRASKRDELARKREALRIINETKKR